MSTLALLRHGQSIWNRQHRFTGWSDVPLSPRGVEECRRAAAHLAADALRFDVCFTSVLSRGTEAARHTLEALGQADVPVERSWYLNERHFGALQGLGRWDAVRAYGPFAVMRWQRSYSLRPPSLDEDDPRHPARDPLYAELPAKELPLSESLADTCARVVPYWETAIAPRLRAGENVLIAAHKNSLRVLVKHLEGLPDADAPRLRLPTGEPVVYEFDAQLVLLDRRTYSPQARRVARWTGISPA